MTLFRRILVPHDFSAPADRALAVAADLAADRRGRLVVLHVITPLPPIAALPADSSVWIPDSELIAAARPQLETIVRRTLGRRRVPVECRVEVGDPFHRITRAARGCDTIVMATAGRTGLSHLLIGSVAEKVVRHATVPVMTVHPGPVRAKAPAGRRVRRIGRRAARRR